MLYIHNYQSVLEPAKKFYDAAGRGEAGEASEYSSLFFEQANRETVIKQGEKAIICDLSGKIIDKADSITQKFNPNIARMALQQAYADIEAGHWLLYNEDLINEKKYNQIQKNCLTARLQTVFSTQYRKLNKQIKKLYPKTYKKRLAIIPQLFDGAQVKLRNQYYERTSQTEKELGEDLGLACVKELKKRKKFRYFMRLLFTR